MSIAKQVLSAAEFALRPALAPIVAVVAICVAAMPPLGIRAPQVEQDPKYLVESRQKGTPTLRSILSTRIQLRM